MKSVLMASVAATALLLSACGTGEDSTTAESAADTVAEATAAAKPELGSWGVTLSDMQTEVPAGTNFFQHVNGKWLDSFEIPADRNNYGSFTVLAERSETRVRAIIEELGASASGEAGSAEQMVGDYYKSWMNVDLVNEKGVAPLQPILDQIAAISDVEGLTRQFGRAAWDGGVSPISGGLSINRLNPDEYQYSISASGLGLPDRDYYLSEEERFVDIRAKYVAHIAEMLAFTGVEAADAAAQAEAIVALETKIADKHWPRAERRNRDKTLNPTEFSALATSYTGFDWGAYFEGVGAQPEVLNVSHPSAMQPIADLVAGEDLATWKAYLTFHTLSNHAGLLSEEIDQASFAFGGTVLSGTETQRERWKRGVTLVGGLSGLGEALGQVYVDRHFPEAAKTEMVSLVENLRAALAQRIEGLDWMGSETKQEALAKLAAFRPKIGYPDKWRDYSGLTIRADDLFNNFVGLRHANQKRALARLSQKTDKDEWFMTPQTVNAYYNPPFNEIVFPAAILQPPFFDLAADPAVNYGAIGAVIGHEMGHGFDDQGSKSDATGVQRNWWTDEDRANFEKQADALVNQYNGYEALEGAFVDGRFTLGENIGDVGGLSMAYHAYKLSLNGEEAPVIDGYTGDQRFFLSWAQVWKRLYREQALLARLKSDPHSPSEFRVNGVVRNLDAWYEAFGITEDDPLYLPPEERVTIW